MMLVILDSQRKCSTHLVGIFLINVIFNSHGAKFRKILGRDLDQIRDGGLPQLVKKISGLQSR